MLGNSPGFTPVPTFRGLSAESKVPATTLDSADKLQDVGIEGAVTMLEEFTINSVNDSVLLQLNMAHYIALAKAYNSAPSRYTSSSMNEEKSRIANLLYGDFGDPLFCKILHEFKKIMPLSSPDQHALFNKPYPLVFEWMIEYEGFIEVVKNSMDSLITKIIKSGREPENAIMCIEIKVKIHENKISLCIEDNGGGFSKDFIEGQTAFKAACSDRKKRTTGYNKTPFENMLFGGNGRGLRMLRDFMLTGKIRKKHLSDYIDIQHYDVKEGESDLSFSNTFHGGARVVLTSLSKAYPKINSPEDELLIPLRLPDNLPRNDAKADSQPALGDFNLNPVENKTIPTQSGLARHANWRLSGEDLAHQVSETPISMTDSHLSRNDVLSAESIGDRTVSSAGDLINALIRELSPYQGYATSLMFNPPADVKPNQLSPTPANQP